jgi:hypothetical protein
MNAVLLIRRKVRTFRTDPTAAIKAKMKNVVPALLRSHGLRRLSKDTHVLESLKMFQSGRESHAFAPDYGDLWFLYRAVRQRRPKVIFEFGSGNTTVCLAQALFDNGAGNLWSMDGDKAWAESTARCLPAYLKPIAEVRYNEVKKLSYPDTLWAVKHVELPKLIPDFVFLDGPEGVGKGRPAIDLLEMEPFFPPGFFLVIDDRKENTQFLREHFKRQYRFRRRRIAAQPTFELIK